MPREKILVVLREPLATTSIQLCICATFSVDEFFSLIGTIFQIVTQRVKRKGAICARYQRKTKHTSGKTDSLQFVWRQH